MSISHPGVIRDISTNAVIVVPMKGKVVTTKRREKVARNRRLFLDHLVDRPGVLRSDEILGLFIGLLFSRGAAVPSTR